VLLYDIPTANDDPILAGFSSNPSSFAVDLPSAKNLAHSTTLASLVATDDLNSVPFNNLKHNH
jgi:hypothetical protein